MQHPGRVVARTGVEQMDYKFREGNSCYPSLMRECTWKQHPPFFSFSHEKKSKPHFLTNRPPGGQEGANLSGWMCEEQFVIFLKRLILNVKSTKDFSILFLLGNHDSHLSIEGLNFASDDGIVMLSVPTCCNHILQPLDKAWPLE